MAIVISDFQTTPLQAAQVFGYARRMNQEGLPEQFVGQALKLAQFDQGVYELFELWAESNSREEKNELIADIQELIEDYQQSGPEKIPQIPFRALEGISKSIVEHKRKLREIIEQHGGVTQAARLSGIPQPSLSRMLNSGSMPRKSTLYKIAKGLHINESELIAEWAI